MSLSIESFGWDALWLIVGAVLLLTVLLVAGRVLALLPASRARRELVARYAPVAATLLVLAYLLFATRKVFGAQPESLPFAIALLLFGFAAAGWFAIRDVIAGVFIKAGRLCRVGDHVQIDDVRGRVTRIGYRVIAIETGQGDEAIVPFSAITRRALLRTPVLEGAALHLFRVQAPAALTVSDVKRRVQQSALCCHWSNVARMPEVTTVAPNVYEVTVYALDSDHAPEVELAVRQSLEAAASDTASGVGVPSHADEPAPRAAGELT